MPSKVWSAALTGLDAHLVAVEADAGGGDFGQISIVGLPDAAVYESRERVRSVIRNCNLEFPRRKITVNLAPANLKKYGPSYDLPIAVSILRLKNNFPFDFGKSLLAGELSLSGDVHPVSGVLAMAETARANGIKTLLLPTANASEALLIPGLTIIPIVNLIQLIAHLKGTKPIKPALKKEKNTNEIAETEEYFYQIKGQTNAKRVLEIAAAGQHNLLLSGPPGSGKSLLAKAFPSIMPDLSPREKLEVSRIYSAAGLLKEKDRLLIKRPFRSPHHSISATALIGGGSRPQPGEISLAHRGVLFMDEFPEFSRSALENLRQPLENGKITIGRAAGSYEFPANFILLAAMNPCPCGYLGDKRIDCHCSPREIDRYRQKLSGPIIDRLDLQVEVPRLNLRKLQETAPSRPSSLEIKQKVAAARQIQIHRFRNSKIMTNSEMSNQAVNLYCYLGVKERAFIELAGDKLYLSARSYFRILKIARTIADLETQERIRTDHLAEALQYRPKL